MNAPIAQSARIAAELRARLAAEYNLAEDDEAIDDTVAGEVDLPELIANLARDAVRSEAFAKGLAELIKGEQARKARLEHKAEKARALIAWAMAESGFRKMPLPDMTLTLSAGKRPLIVDEGADIPSDFLIPQPGKLDRKELRDVLEYAESHSIDTHITFARLGNAAPVLTIRKG